MSISEERTDLFISDKQLYDILDDISNLITPKKIRGLLLNKQDFINYNKALDEQIEKLEKEIDYLKKEIIKHLERLPKDNTKTFIDTIKAKVEEEKNLK